MTWCLVAYFLFSLSVPPLPVFRPAGPASAQVDGWGCVGVGCDAPHPHPAPFFAQLPILVFSLSFSGLAPHVLGSPALCPASVLCWEEWRAAPSNAVPPRAPDAYCVSAGLTRCWQWEGFTFSKFSVSPLEFLKIKAYFWLQYVVYIFSFKKIVVKYTYHKIYHLKYF